MAVTTRQAPQASASPQGKRIRAFALLFAPFRLVKRRARVKLSRFARDERRKIEPKDCDR